MALAIDEVKYEKGHRYLTVMCDYITGEVIGAAKGRSKETVAAVPLVDATPRTLPVTALASHVEAASLADRHCGPGLMSLGVWQPTLRNGAPRLASSGLAIIGATVVDPARGTTSVRDLHVSSGRIVAVDSDFAPETVLDASGLHAIPGLIDMHVHMTSDPFGNAASGWSKVDSVTMTLSAVANLGTALRHGITTVRDLGARGDLGYAIRSAWRRGVIVGARPVVAGPVITSIGGHGNWLGVESEGPAHIGALVRRNAAKGSDVIKLMMSSAARPMELRPQEVAKGVEEAHWQGLPVAVHANFSERSIDTAVEAGCDTLEHGFAISQDTASAMAAQGTALCATTVALQSIVDNASTWRQRAGSAIVDRAIWQLPRARQSFELAMSSGVTLIAGTDAGVTSVGFEALPRELETMVRWGATTQQALAAATSQAAALLRRDHLGRLDFGSVADVVLLEGDPLRDIEAVASVVAVIQDGAVVRLDDPSRLARGDVASPPGAILQANRAATHDSIQ